MQLQSLLSRFTTDTISTSPAPRNRAQAASAGLVDERRYIRSPINARIDVCWQDAPGSQKQTPSRGVNISSVGASVISPHRIAVGSAVYLRSKDLQLMGNATVRHCTERKSKFLIGLEFRGSLLRSF
ncbi:MAG TPA: PilZ domain-containing protein [Bryobacteraceae bacterium]|nr:PilZ domain-containing protein [Bryobacteraceae bacterium]